MGCFLLNFSLTIWVKLGSCTSILMDFSMCPSANSSAVRTSSSCTVSLLISALKVVESTDLIPSAAWHDPISIDSIPIMIQ
ncbi:Uncharacterised protein [Chlamydia trachomatis]|nr:Uncharacterised protein [Chlamydia trachomatis]